MVKNVDKGVIMNENKMDKLVAVIDGAVIALVFWAVFFAVVNSLRGINTRWRLACGE